MWIWIQYGLNCCHENYEGAENKERGIGSKHSHNQTS
jgi:hypothetical protein